MPIPTEQQPVPSVGVNKAYGLFTAGEATFVDVRDREAYDKSHIPGAISMPLREIFERYTELSRDHTLVFY